MTKLKPQLIIAGPSKKKGGFASGVGYFLVLAIVFALGVYVGMGVNNSQFGSEQIIGMGEGEKSSISDSAAELKRETTVSSTQEVVTDNNDPAKSSTAADNSYSDEPFENPHSGAGLNEVKASDDAVVVSSLSRPGANLNNSTDGLDSGTVSGALIDRDSYRLQVAAFGSFDQANEAVNDLKIRGYDAYVVTTSNSRGEVWNLVKVGKFDTAQEAWNYSTIFQSQEGGEVFVESLSKGRVYNLSLEENNDTL